MAHWTQSQHMQGKQRLTEHAQLLVGSELKHLVKTQGIVTMSMKPTTHIKKAHMNASTEETTNSKAATECPVYISSETSDLAAPSKAMAGGGGAQHRQET